MIAKARIFDCYRLLGVANRTTRKRGWMRAERVQSALVAECARARSSRLHVRKATSGAAACFAHQNAACFDERGRVA